MSRKERPKRKSIVMVSQIDVPKDKLNEYQEAFDLIDKDHSGLINVDEICKLMKNMGNNIPKQQIWDIVNKIDR